MTFLPYCFGDLFLKNCLCWIKKDVCICAHARQNFLCRLQKVSPLLTIWYKYWSHVFLVPFFKRNIFFFLHIFSPFRWYTHIPWKEDSFPHSFSLGFSLHNVVTRLFYSLFWSALYFFLVSFVFLSFFSPINKKKKVRRNNTVILMKSYSFKDNPLICFETFACIMVIHYFLSFVDVMQYIFMISSRSLLIRSSFHKNLSSHIGSVVYLTFRCIGNTKWVLFYPVPCVPNLPSPQIDFENVHILTSICLSFFPSFRGIESFQQSNHLESQVFINPFNFVQKRRSRFLLFSSVLSSD